MDDGNRKHQLDVYLPPSGDGPFPTLFVIHGLSHGETGFGTASKEIHRHLAATFAERGYAVVSIDYQWPSEPFQQQMTRDAFCALAWVHANAEAYGFDTQRIAILGEDWGAATAAKLGAVDDPGPFLEGCPHPAPKSGWVDGIVTYSGHFETPEADLGFSMYLALFARAHGTQSKVGYKELERIFETLGDLSPQAWREGEGLDEAASEIAQLLPLYWIDGSEPPFLLVDGQYDLGILHNTGVEHPAESEAFAAELQAAGVDAKLLQLADIRWTSLRTEEPPEHVLQAIEAFLDELFE
jgi:acetyl esterase/lipase